MTPWRSPDCRNRRRGGSHNKTLTKQPFKQDGEIVAGLLSLAVLPAGEVGEEGGMEAEEGKTAGAICTTRAGCRLAHQPNND